MWEQPPMGQGSKVRENASVNQGQAEGSMC